MPRPGFTIAIALPGSHGADEDNLDREGHKAGNGKGDLATQTVSGIARALQEGGPSSVRDLRGVCEAFEDMCNAILDRDGDAFEHAASGAVDGLRELLNRNR